MPRSLSFPFRSWTVRVSGSAAILPATRALALRIFGAVLLAIGASDHSFAQASAWNQAKLVPHDGARGDRFGYAVALDGNVALVGAFGDGDLGFEAGSAYVFRFDPATERWVEEAKLLASDGQSNDHFGRSVAVSGNRALIGAFEDGDLGGHAGSAYVFRYGPVTADWIEEAKLLAFDGDALDFFGWSVAIDGELALIGAYGDEPRGASSGSVYPFHFDPASASWVAEPKISPPDGRAYDRFGDSVALDGSHAVVGASRDDDAGRDSGSAYFFRRDALSGSWIGESKATGSSLSTFDRFGSRVAISGERAVLAGISQETTYVFERSSALSIWEETHHFRNGGIAIVPAVSGDRITLGEPGADEKGNGAGSAFRYRLDSLADAWTPAPKLIAIDGEERAAFGKSVSMSGDRVLVGSHRDDVHGEDSGSAYVLRLVLETSAPSFSAANGVSIEFAFDFPAAHAHHAYTLLASATGDDERYLPGGQVKVPLTKDLLFRRMIHGQPPRGFSDANGLLDSAGDGTANLHLSPGQASGQVGRKVWFAVVSWESAGGGFEARRSSHAATLAVFP